MPASPQGTLGGEETVLEIQRIVAASRFANRGQAALATLVSLDGSGFRRPGARLLVLPGDRLVGGVSAGCLEIDVAEHAKRAIGDGTTRVVPYRTDDTSVFGLGLGCGGRLKVLIEPLALRSGRRHLAFLRALCGLRRAGAIATILSDDGLLGRYFALGGSGRWEEGDAPPFVARIARDAAEAALDEVERTRRPAHQILPVPDGAWILVESLAPPTALLACGRGPDADALAAQAELLGWSVRQADPRTASLGALPTSGAQAAVVMTHHLDHDRSCLEALAGAPLEYLGIVGPRARTERLLAGLSIRAPVFAPVGLDIGAESPEEVALAICAEIQAVLTGRGGGSLRDRRAPIHARDAGS
jgi:xanthine/CO dehydrogenase XdhC/CoxF family maturation factor